MLLLSADPLFLEDLPSSLALRLGTEDFFDLVLLLFVFSSVP